MRLQDRKRGWQGLVGGIGVVAFIAGPIGGVYSLGTAILAAFTIWMIGSLVITVVTED